MKQISRTLVNQLLSQAQHAAQREVCALIGSYQGESSTVYPIKNIARDPRHRFEMSPEQLIGAMRQMRERDEELYAICHSHPDAPAVPSARDIEQSAYPDALYLIISLNTQGVLEMRGFQIHTGEVSEIELEVV